MKRPALYTLFLFLAVSLALTPAFAQRAAPAVPGEEPIPNIQADPDMRVSPLRRPFTLSYGGWLTPGVIDERIGSTDLMTSVTIAKLWLNMTLWPNAFIYARGKDTYQYVLVEKDRDIDDTDNVLDLDAAYLQMANERRTLVFSVGRKFYLLGTGLVFNGRGDGGELGIYTRFLDLKAFGLYTGLLQKDTNTYGLSSKDIATGAKRYFVGGTLGKTVKNQTFYLLGLMQMDQGDQDPGTKTRYQSQYYGAGAKGFLIDGMEYYGEFVYEMGTSYLSGTTEQKDVAAMAGLAGINYYFNAASNPGLLFQYAYGSGDEDRAGYTSATGNAAGDDNGFVYFGTYLGGYGLRPRLSNLHIGRAGFSFTPFYGAKSVSLRRLALLAHYSYYMKDNSKGTINDGEATEDNRNVGQGVDVSLRWAAFYDLSVFANYGLFLPGAAYPSSEENRNFTMVGVNLVF